MEITADVKSRSKAVVLLLRLWEAVTIKVLVVFGFIGLALFALVAGFVNQNPSVLVGLIGGFIVWIAWLFWLVRGIRFVRYLKEWLWEGILSKTAWENHFPKFPSYDNSPMSLREVLTVFSPWVLILFASCFIFIADSAVWIVKKGVNAKRIGTNGLFLAVPFAEDIIYLNKDQTVTLEARALTADSIMVQAEITANVRMPQDEKMISESVKHHQEADVNKQLGMEVRYLLRMRFADTIAERRLADLANSLVIEYETGKEIHWNNLWLQWDGVLKVEDLHVSFKK